MEDILHDVFRVGLCLQVIEGVKTQVLRVFIEDVLQIVVEIVLIFQEFIYRANLKYFIEWNIVCSL